MCKGEFLNTYIEAVPDHAVDLIKTQSLLERVSKFKKSFVLRKKIK